jgi:hypothetical protein
MTEVQLPEDLKKMAYAAANKTYNELQYSNVVTFAIVDAVLAALFDACEVDVKLTSRTPDGGWILPAGDWQGSLKATHRQLVITTPPELVSGEAEASG